MRKNSNNMQISDWISKRDCRHRCGVSVLLAKLRGKRSFATSANQIKEYLLGNEAKIIKMTIITWSDEIDLFCTRYWSSSTLAIIIFSCLTFALANFSTKQQQQKIDFNDYCISCDVCDSRPLNDMMSD